MRLQQGVLDVSSFGGVTSFFHAVASDAGTVAEGRVGTGDGCENGGKELSFKRMEDSIFGPKDPGFGPSRLVKGVPLGPLKESGEPLGPFKEIQEGLGCREREKGAGFGLVGQGSRPIDSVVVMDCRPIVSIDAMGCKEGNKGSGPGLEGLVVEDGGTLVGEGPSASLPKAHLLCLERGVNGEPDPLALGEDPSADCTRARSLRMERGVNEVDDPIVGSTRDAKPLEVSAVVERGSMTDEALCVEASRYVEYSALSVGGQELSYSSISFELDQAGAKEGALTGLVSVVEG